MQIGPQAGRGHRNPFSFSSAVQASRPKIAAPLFINCGFELPTTRQPCAGLVVQFLNKRGSMRHAVLGIILGLSLFGAEAMAACSGPEGVEGQIIYNRKWKVMQFCDDTRWVGMGSSNTGVGVAGSVGEIQFNDGSGALAADSDLFWDNTNKRIGIGSTSPVAKLHVSADNAAVYDAGQILISGITSPQKRLSMGFDTTNDMSFIQSLIAGDTYYNLALNPHGGNVGIGTTSPVSQLDLGTSFIHGTPSTTKELANKISLWHNGDTLHYGIGVSQSALNLVAGETGGSIRFHTGGANERMTIANNGNVGIGTNNPGQRLSVQGAANYIMELNSTAPASGANHYMLRIIANGANPGGIFATTTATTYATSSDYRLKEGIEPLHSGIGQVMQLRPVRFSFKADKAHEMVEGFIAHEVQDIAPYTVIGMKDGINSDGSPNYQKLDYGRLTPILTAAIQELKAENDNLRDQVSTFEKRLRDLERAAK